MKKCRGFSLAELIIALGLTAALLLTLSATWLYAQQLNATLYQARFAEQYLNNVATELFAHQHEWNPAMLATWQATLSASLPQAQLVLKPNSLQIHWPSRISLKIHCETETTLSCVGMVF